MINGRCLCGQLTYTVIDEFKYSFICHCSQCRRATGSAFKPFAGIESHKLILNKSLQEPLIFGSELNHDVHCRVCGSLLYSLVQDGQMVHVTLGTMMDEVSIQPTAHIFVGSKASWYEISDQRPQYQEFPHQSSLN